MKKRLQPELRRRCAGVGALCFLVALVASMVAANEASADTSPTAIKGTPLVVPAAVLGVSSPYIIRAALPTPTVHRFLLSEDVRDLVRRVDKLARYGVDLNQRTPQPEKLHLRFQSIDFGGLLQLCYQR